MGYLSDIVENVEGWMEEPELEWLYNTARRLPVCARVLEIGSFMGRSAAAMLRGLADADKEIHAGLGDYEMHCIDTWDARGTCRSEEIAAHTEKDDLWLYKACANNLERYGGSKRFHLHRANSNDAGFAKTFKWTINFLFIDGNHEEDSVRRDLELWVPAVAGDGVIAGHDYHESWPGVVAAVDSLAIDRGWTVTNPVGGIWCVRL